MTYRDTIRSLTVVLGVSALTSPAAAGNPSGIWARTDGKAHVQIAACGAALCGTVVWLKNPNGPGAVGERVFFDMMPTSADHWSGSAHNPEDGRDYDGTMVLSGGRLTTQGCALGGMICRTVYWTRAPLAPTRPLAPRGSLTGLLC